MQWVCIKHNGYKRIHAFKFQSVTVKNGLIVSYIVHMKAHDAGMLRESALLVPPHCSAWSNGYWC